jgi:hypothetical protein
MTLYHDHMTVVNDRDRLLAVLINVTNRLALHAPRGNGDVIDQAKAAIDGRDALGLKNPQYLADVKALQAFVDGPSIARTSHHPRCSDVQDGAPCDCGFTPSGEAKS